MANAYYIGTALRTVDPKMWWGWDGQLAGTVPDIILTQKKLEKLGYESHILLTQKCTVENVIKLHVEIANKAVAGDIVVWWHSGHGADKISDGAEGETGGKTNDIDFDEAIALYDVMMTDNQIARTLSMYKKGVRLVVAFDTCHSGQMYRFIPDYKNSLYAEFGEQVKMKYVPRDIQDLATLKIKNAEDFAPAYSLLPKSPTIKADLKVYGACQVNQTAADLGTNGFFTKVFWNVYDDFGGKLPYVTLHKKMLPKCPSDQTPSYYTQKGNSTRFNNENVFTI